MRSRIQSANKRKIFKKLLNILFYSFSILFLALVVALAITHIYNNNQRVSELEAKILLMEEKEERSLAEICDEKESIRKARASVVRIVGEAEGSGFAGDDQGLIVTNFHVIEFEPSPKVVLPDGTFETAEILMADKEADIAFLQIESFIPGLPLGDSGLLEQTDEVYTLGFPFGGDLQGELTVKKGILAGKRKQKESDIVYLQTDSTINPGLSGGPMVNRCGEIVGMMTLGAAGAGFAISSESVLAVWERLENSDTDPLKDIRVLEIKPDESPLLAVQAFYDYIKIRRLDKAFELLGEYKKNFKFANWKKGYEANLDTTVLGIQEDETDPSKIHVQLSTKDLVEGNIVYRYFEGFWMVQEIEGKFLLRQPEIEEI